MNTRLIKDFKAHLEECEKVTRTSPMYSQNSGYTFTPKTRETLVRMNDGVDDFVECGKDPSSYSDVANVFFYEFSSLDKGCKHFNSLASFYEWAESCHITFEYQIKSSINYGTACWVFCVPGKYEAIAKNSRSGVKRFLEKVEKGQEIIPYDKSFYN